MFQLSGEEIASIVVVAGLVVLHFRTLKDLDRERRERIELKEEVLELAEQLGKALREQEKSALKVSEVTGQLDKARREQIELQEKFVSRRAWTFSLVPEPLTVAFDPRGPVVVW